MHHLDHLTPWGISFFNSNCGNARKVVHDDVSGIETGSVSADMLTQPYHHNTCLLEPTSNSRSNLEKFVAKQAPCILWTNPNQPAQKEQIFNLYITLSDVTSLPTHLKTILNFTRSSTRLHCSSLAWEYSQSTGRSGNWVVFTKFGWPPLALTLWHLCVNLQGRKLHLQANLLS